MLEGAPASDGPLTVAQAVEALTPKETKPVEQATAAPEQAAEEAVETEQPDATTSEVASEAEAPGDGEKTETEQESEGITLQPPTWWSHEKKARFKELPPDLQAVVFEQEETRERVVAKAKQEGSEAKKAAEEIAAKYTQRINVLDNLVPQAAQMFQSRWANVDWQAAADTMEPQDYQRARAQFEKERDSLSELARQHQTALEERQREFVKAESAKLRDVAPDLVDEKPDPDTKQPIGQVRQQQVGKFLVDLGFTVDRINAMSAHEASLAYDAMRWRKAQESAKAMAKPKAAPSPAATVRPTAAPPAGNTETARVREAQLRFNKAPSLSNAVLLAEAKRLSK